MKRILVYAWVFPTTLLGLIFYLPTILFGGRGKIVEGVLELHGGFATFALKHFTRVFIRGGASAMTLGHVVIGQDEFLLNATRRHERVHVRQCERWGPLFIPAYLLASLVVMCRGKCAYMDNPFEREAYGHDV